MRKIFFVLCLSILGCVGKVGDPNGATGSGGSGGTPATDGRAANCSAALTNPYRYESLLSDADYSLFEDLQTCLCQFYANNSQLCAEDVPWTYTNTPNLYSSPGDFPLCAIAITNCQNS